MNGLESKIFHAQQLLDSSLRPLAADNLEMEFKRCTGIGFYSKGRWLLPPKFITGFHQLL